MLDQCDARVSAGELCTRVECHVALPEGWDDYFRMEGRMPGRFNERRAHPRFYLRCKAVLRLDDQTHGIYMKDISRSGVGFLHDSQLMPKQRCAILLPNGSWLQLKLVRCRRLAPNCYECGAVHHHGE